jgi:hypothetical protein
LLFQPWVSSVAVIHLDVEFEAQHVDADLHNLEFNLYIVDDVACLNLICYFVNFESDSEFDVETHDYTSELKSQSFDVGFQHDVDHHVHLQICFLDFESHSDFDSDFANSEVDLVDPKSMKIVHLLT